MNFNSEFELKFDIKTNVENMEDILLRINENIAKEFFNDNILGQTNILSTATVKKIRGNDVGDKILDINQQISKLNHKGNISDGSHTFDELYYHRMMLFSIICNSYKNNAWKSWKHEDGTMVDDYFIVGITTSEGDYSYHYHKNYWYEFDVEELVVAPKWDGHNPSDIRRLLALLQC